ncbi:hypothetical protein CDAR_314321 [Caerostris darwini]|uniref:Uncharacterized protein n=1 Tax=Caerostris darwini TaxID=1538125 RepID=A0AAV4U7J6_9ARAC|nr:hypothetical protein CDAR_314321 [Caerostris darwini]
MHFVNEYKSRNLSFLFIRQEEEKRVISVSRRIRKKSNLLTIQMESLVRREAGALGVAFLWIFRPSAVPFGVASSLAWARPAVDRELINDDARDI